MELCCDRGASITYHSPQYGLASQVAAQEAHLHCAEILWDRMCQTIDNYRKQRKPRCLQKVFATWKLTSAMEDRIKQSKKQVEDTAVLEQELKSAK